jgi:hypothetical protein
LKSIAEKLISFFGRNPGIIYLFALVVWALTLAAKLLYNGLIFGFDYGLFHPDGALYSFRALLWSGHSENEAGRLVGEWYRSNSFNAQYQGPELYYKNNAFLWDQYSGRILYPLLSVPFVKLFGVGGMLVVPAATMLFVLLVTSRIALNLKVPAIGYLAIILISLDKHPAMDVCEYHRWATPAICINLCFACSKKVESKPYKNRPCYIVNNHHRIIANAFFGTYLDIGCFSLFSPQEILYIVPHR